MRFLILLPLIVSLAFGKSSQGNWSPSKSRNGATTRTPPVVNQARINTSGLSNPNRSASVTPRPAPIIAAPPARLAPVATVAPTAGKINTSALSDPNRGAPKPAPVAQQTPVTVNKTVNVVVTKKIVVDHRYDSYRHTPAPVVIVDHRPVYRVRGRDYVIVQRGNAYYSNVDGNYIEMTPTGSGWDIVEPVPAPVVQPQPQRVAAPVVQRESAPQIVEQESHVGTVLLAVFGVVVLGVMLLWFLRSRSLN